MMVITRPAAVRLRGGLRVGDSLPRSMELQFARFESSFDHIERLALHHIHRSQRLDALKQLLFPRATLDQLWST